MGNDLDEEVVQEYRKHWLLEPTPIILRAHGLRQGSAEELEAMRRILAERQRQEELQLEATSAILQRYRVRQGSEEELEAMRQILVERQEKEHNVDFTDLDLAPPSTPTTFVPPPDALTCPKCSKTAGRRPAVTWRGFQTSLVAYFMSLFTINKMIETATQKANAPRQEDFLFNPFVQRAPREYVAPDYSPLYIVGVVGLCVVVFLFFSALRARYKCETCGYSWKR